MKKIFCMMLLLSLLAVPYASAQMGGSKSGGMMGGQKGGMMERQGSQGHMEGMLKDHEVMGGMMHNMGQMSRLMQQMREMMANKPDAESMREMSGLMQDMSKHIMEMSRIMKRGSVTQKEIQELDQHNLLMQKQYDEMRW